MLRISTAGIISAADPHHLRAGRFHRFFLWLQNLLLPGGKLSLDVSGSCVVFPAFVISCQVLFAVWFQLRL